MAKRGLRLIFLLIVLVALVGRFVRILLGFHLEKKLGRPIQFAQGIDVAQLTDDPNNSLSFGVIMLKGVADLHAIRIRIYESWFIDGTHYVKLKQTLQKKFGYYFWLFNNNFRMEDHVVEYDGILPMNYSELNLLYGKLCSESLPKDIFWQFVVIPLADNFTGPEPGRYHVLFIKVCQGLADGVSMLRMLNEGIFDINSVHRIPAQNKHKKSMSITNFLQSFFLGPFLLFKAVLFRNRHNLCSSSSKATGIRLVSSSPLIPLERMQEITNQTATTVNDVFVSCIAGSLRAHFLSEGTAIPNAANLKVPVSFHDFTQPSSFCNNSSYVFPSLNLEDYNALDRLILTSRQMKQEKSSPILLTLYLYMKLCANNIPKFIYDKLFSFTRITGVASNLAGPFSRESRITGCQVVQMMALGPNLKKPSIAFTLTSSGGELTFAISAEASLMKKQEVVDRFIHFFVKEFETLEKAIEQFK